MKTELLLIILILLVGALLFVVIKYCIKNRCCESTTPDDTEIISHYTNSYHGISIDKVQRLYNNYNNRFVNAIKEIQRQSFPNDPTRNHYLPTQYSIVPLKRLKDYIAFVEVLQKKNPSQTISGVAISLGSYNLDKTNKNNRCGRYPLDPVKEGDYRGRLTTFLTPTYYDNSDATNNKYDASKHVPFYIEYDNESDKFKGTYKSLYQYLETNNTETTRASRASVKSSSSNIQSASDNEFTDMPPKKVGGSNN